jgi:hypothetical protein
MRKKRGKRVRFDTCYETVPRPADPTSGDGRGEEYDLDDIKEDVWFTASEFKAIRVRENKLSRDLSSTFSNYKFSRDGIESVSYHQLRRKRVREAVLAVLLEQEACWNGTRRPTFDRTVEEYIAGAYSRCSQIASMLAIDRATTLEKQVRAMA